MTLQQKKQYRGLTALANKIGVSPSHLSRVAHGLRSSKRLALILEEAGIKVKRTKK